MPYKLEYTHSCAYLFVDGTIPISVGLKNDFTCDEMFEIACNRNRDYFQQFSDHNHIHATINNHGKNDTSSFDH
jgi:hypothetical protein